MRIRALPAATLRVPILVYRGARPGRLSPCRFEPSCSSYALDALSSHGALRGISLIVRRLARCRPGGGSGFDPVPIGRVRPSQPS